MIAVNMLKLALSATCKASPVAWQAFPVGILTIEMAGFISESCCSVATELLLVSRTDSSASPAKIEIAPLVSKGTGPAPPLA